MDSVAGWRDLLADAFVRLEPDRARGIFRGRVEQCSLTACQISLVEADAHRVRRLQEHVAQHSREVTFVNLQLSAAGRNTQRGATAIARPLDLSLMDATEAYDIDHDTPFSLYSIALPHRLMPDGLRHRDHVPLSATPLGREVAGLIAGTARACLLAARQPGGAAGILEQQLLGLLGYAGELALTAAPQRLSVRADLILAHIARHFREPDCSAAAIARQLGLSTRYLHRLMEATGRTVSEHVNDRRLAAVAEQLERGERGAHITGLAYDAGFRDLSHFNRRFRARYGETPRAYAGRHRASRGADRQGA